MSCSLGSFNVHLNFFCNSNYLSTLGYSIVSTLPLVCLMRQRAKKTKKIKLLGDFFIYLIVYFVCFFLITMHILLKNCIPFCFLFKCNGYCVYCYLWNAQNKMCKALKQCRNGATSNYKQKHQLSHPSCERHPVSLTSMNRP